MVGIGTYWTIKLLLTRFRMSEVCESWTLEELCEMDEHDMESLLRFFKPGKVPSFEKIRLQDDSEGVPFDGSFGWW